MEEILKPRVMLRVLVGVLLVVVIFGPLLFAQIVKFSDNSTSLADFLEATDAGLHMLLLLGRWDCFFGDFGESAAEESGFDCDC